MIRLLSLTRTVPISFSATPIASLTSSFPHRHHHSPTQKRHACQVHHPTKLGQLRAKLRGFGQGHIELDFNHSTGLALLTLHNPEKHNALTGKMMAELADCVDLLEELTVPSSSASVTSMALGSSNDAQIRPFPALHPESKLVLKNAGQKVTRLDQELVSILDGVVGIIVTGADHKSYCAGL
ncbi:hypothetical protein BG000_003255, partial [Podila horticola]